MRNIITKPLFFKTIYRLYFLQLEKKVFSYKLNISFFIILNRIIFFSVICVKWFWFWTDSLYTCIISNNYLNPLMYHEDFDNLTFRRQPLGGHWPVVKSPLQQMIRPLTKYTLSCRISSPERKIYRIDYRSTVIEVT